ncbi:MAG: hypothetical protein RR359_05395, partial [Bacilli bacterium]
PDGSMKAIMDDSISGSLFHKDSNAYATSYVKEWLETYFYPRLNSSKDTVLKQNNDFCIDGVADADKDTSMRTTCTSKLSNLKVGLLSLDEYNIVMNGGNINYLVNEKYYWTITPSLSNISREWILHGTGVASTWEINYGCSVRPVINFMSTNVISLGNGSMKNPYQVKNDIPGAAVSARLNTRYTGELISYDNKLWRIMEISGDLTKVIYDGAIKLAPDGVFGVDNLDWATMKAKLESIGISTIKIAQNQTWQRGYFDYGNSTINTSLTNGNPVTSTFGLPKVGEMWASQNNNKTANYAKYIVQYYWTMTPFKTNNTLEWSVDTGGGSFFNAVVNDNLNYNFGIRPCFFFKSDVTINSGDGTPNSPYILQ